MSATTLARSTATDVVNDIHSRLNPVRVERCPAGTVSAVVQILERAARERKAVSLAGGRHSMGAQQFGTGTLFLDTSALHRILDFDSGSGLIEVEAGIRWPDLVRGSLELQGSSPRWGIAQKQTGADRLSVGGSLSANAHGRGLAMKPIVADVESFLLLDANGCLRYASRTENAGLFRLVIGGYGLFGVLVSVTLRLAPRRKLERMVELLDAGDLMPAFAARIADGHVYGDFQFAIDERSDDFLRRGVLSTYRPVDPSTPMPPAARELSPDHWRELLYLAHTDKSEAFRKYAEHYLSTSGQLYWSDMHQLGVYLDGYHRDLDVRLGSRHDATEVITEIYVPRDRLADLLVEVREDFGENGVDLIYGTVRLIERDDETFLPWARERFACVVFNLHTVHTPRGIAHSAASFRRLIDMAIRRGGSYFLTYHKYARRGQVEACYPEFAAFLEQKLEFDPEERFQSDWYRHYRDLFAGGP